LTLPLRFWVQLDRASENNSTSIVYFFACLVHCGWTNAVIISHLDVGHTHGPPDQSFSVTNIFMHFKDPMSMPEYMSVISQAFLNQTTNVVVDLLEDAPDIEYAMTRPKPDGSGCIIPRGVDRPSFW
jgi:hypothetical protein